MESGAAEKSAPAAEAEPNAPTASSDGSKFRALYPYGGQHDDELSFEAGDIITLLSKDEEAWWKGELNGKSGVFPSNYVEELSCKFPLYAVGLSYFFVLFRSFTS